QALDSEPRAALESLAPELAVLLAHHRFGIEQLVPGKAQRGGVPALLGLRKGEFHNAHHLVSSTRMLDLAHSSVGCSPGIDFTPRASARRIATTKPCPSRKMMAEVRVVGKCTKGGLVGAGSRRFQPLANQPRLHFTDVDHVFAFH